jgi:adenosylcobinamide-GDP ribazoletransferase
VAEALRLTAVAFQFLTRIRVPAIPVHDGDLRRASAAFPLVGIVVGAVGVAVRGGAEPLWGPVPATIAAVLAMIATTGAFHEDGLADTADGLWGGWDPEQRLAIMKDSRLGTYGTVALVGVLALRVALLAALPFAVFAAATLCGAVLGRASILVLVRLLPPASRSAESVAGVAGPLGTAVAAATAGLVVAVAARWWAPLLVAAGLLVVAACRRLLRRRIGGVTGDTLGATNQLVEVAVIAAVAALAGGGWW